MIVLDVLALGVVVGFFSCHMLRRNHQQGIGYLSAALAVIFGGIAISLIGGEDQTSWYLEALAIGFILHWIIVSGGYREIKRLLTK